MRWQLMTHTSPTTEMQNRTIVATRLRPAWFFPRHRWLIMCLLFCGTLSLLPETRRGRVMAQVSGDTQEPPSIIERDPFDRITVIERNVERTMEILPVKLPGRLKPKNPSPSDKLRVQFPFRPDDDFEIAWRDVQRLQLYEEIVLEEAEAALNQQPPQIEKAAEYLQYLLREHPDLEGLEQFRQRFLYVDAGLLFLAKKYHLALGVLDELYQRNSTFRPNRLPSVSESIGRTLDKIAEKHLNAGNYGAVRQFLNHISGKYGETHQPVVDQWMDQLTAKAEEKKAEARKQLDDGNGRRAHEAVREMVNILPTIAGRHELQLEVARKYPYVFIAVDQPDEVTNPARLDNWAARRVGKLTRRSIVEMVEQGLDGGHYTSPYGTIEISESGTEMYFRLSKNAATGAPAVKPSAMASRLLELADPRSKEYEAGWGRLVQSIAVSLQDVQIQLRQAHVIPEALLRVPFKVRGDRSARENGTYTTAARDPGVEVRFKPNVTRRRQRGLGTPHIVERYYKDSQAATRAILRGDVDVVDRVFPGDVQRLTANAAVNVRPYALPTVHMLVPTRRNRHMKNHVFRRALVFGINREAILHELLLDGTHVPGCQVISGPFPTTTPTSEAVGYAYDQSIDPYPYEPSLSRIYSSLADAQVAAMVKQREQEPSRRPRLILAHPAGDVATIACEAIADQWKAVGIRVELKKLAPGETRIPRTDYDFLYVEAAVWEPIVDAPRLLGPDGFARSFSSFLNLALRRLDVATDWTAARRRLYDVHRAVHDEVIVIPLWQTVDHFAYRDTVRGLGTEPLTLYQNIDKWVVQVPDESE